MGEWIFHSQTVLGELLLIQNCPSKKTLLTKTSSCESQAASLLCFVIAFYHFLTSSFVWSRRSALLRLRLLPLFRLILCLVKPPLHASASSTLEKTFAFYHFFLRLLRIQVRICLPLLGYIVVVNSLLLPLFVGLISIPLIYVLVGLWLLQFLSFFVLFLGEFCCSYLTWNSR